MEPKWFFSKSGTVFGPLSSTELQAQALAGNLTVHDFVWQEGTSQWIPAWNVTWIFPPTPPAGSPQPPTQSASNGRVKPPKKQGKARATSSNPFEFKEGDDDQADVQDDELAQNTKPAVKKRRVIMAIGAIAVGALLLSCVICCGINSKSPGGPPAGVVVSGDTATYSVTKRAASPFMSSHEVVAFDIAQDVWAIAKAHPKVKKAVVTVSLSKEGMQDQYGNAWTKDEVMGNIEISDLDDVRKYKDQGLYASNEHVKAVYLYQIMQLKGSRHFGAGGK